MFSAQNTIFFENSRNWGEKIKIKNKNSTEGDVSSRAPSFLSSPKDFWNLFSCQFWRWKNLFWIGGESVSVSHFGRSHLPKVMWHATTWHKIRLCWFWALRLAVQISSTNQNAQIWHSFRLEIFFMGLDPDLGLLVKAYCVVMSLLHEYNLFLNFRQPIIGISVDC